jgi:phage gp29-like protein
MKSFYEWLDQKEEWIDLYMHLLEADELLNSKKGVFNDQSYHDDLIKKLRNLNLDEQANELEMIRISQQDINFANQPNASDYNKKMSLRVAYNTYMDHIESLVKYVYDHVKKMGWQGDVEKEFEKKFPHLSSNRDYYDLG